MANGPNVPLGQGRCDSGEVCVVCVVHAVIEHDVIDHDVIVQLEMQHTHKFMHFLITQVRHNRT